MSYEHVIFEQRGRVGLVTLNRPERLNAWTDTMNREMRDAVERCNADDGVDAIVFTGAGRAYCAGADVSGFKAAVDQAATGGAVRGGSATLGEDNWVEFLKRMPKPTIAAVNGAAVGVGLTHVLPMDIRIAGENARFGTFFIKMALVPELASSYYLSQLVGTGRALEWCLTSRMIEPQEALSAGLVTEVVPADRLVDRAVELGTMIGAQSMTSIAQIKKLFQQNATDSDTRRVMAREGEALGVTRASAEHKEAVNAFLEKRSANFARG